MVRHDDPGVQELVGEYRSLEKLKRFPSPGSEVFLESHDGTQIKTIFYDAHTIRTKAVGDMFIFQRCGDYGNEYIEYLAGEMRYRRKQGYDNCILITGEVRTGKSTVAQQLALAIKPDLSVMQTVFKIEDLDKAIVNSKDGDVIVLDECIDLYSKEWWDQFQIKLVKKLDIMGILHLTLILVLPHRLSLNKDIRDERVKYWINVQAERGTLRRGFATVRECVPNEWYKDPFWDTLATFHFKGSSGPYWDTYSKMKLEFVREMNSSNYLDRQSPSKNIIRNKAIRMLLKQPGMTQQKIAEELGIDQSIISDVKNGVQK